MEDSVELLKPRYKVISDWPGRKDFEVNQIVVLDKDFSPEYKKYEIEDCQGVRTYITSFFEMFPLQFKKLEWWEERRRDQLPKYVKFTLDYWQYKKGDVVEVFNWYNYPRACIFHNYIMPIAFIPVSEAEYLNSQNTKQ